MHYCCLDPVSLVPCFIFRTALALDALGWPKAALRSMQTAAHLEPKAADAMYAALRTPPGAAARRASASLPSPESDSSDAEMNRALAGACAPPPSPAAAAGGANSSGKGANNGRGASGGADWQARKEGGNDRFRAGAFSEALVEYERALASIPDLGTAGVLLSNRAACALSAHSGPAELGAALLDATASLVLDPQQVKTPALELPFSSKGFEDPI